MCRTNAGSQGTWGPGIYLLFIQIVTFKETNQSLQLLVEEEPLGGKLLETRMKAGDPGGGGRDDRRGSAAGSNTDITRGETAGDYNSRETKISKY